MKPLPKQTLLTILVLVLVALNIGLVTFMWYTQRPERGPGGPDTANFLMRELNFDKAQEKKYLELQQHFNDSLEPIREEERNIHDRFFEMMHADVQDSTAVALAIDTMGHIRSQIEYLTYAHFRQVRALCNTEQQKKFEHVISETMRRMGPPPSRRPHGQGRPGDRPDGPPNGPPGN